MGQLKCPFCCDEEFDSHEDLKFHILSIVDNLFCSICGKRCDNLMDLAEHVGRQCRDDEEEEETIRILEVENDEQDEYNQVFDVESETTEPADNNEKPDEEVEETIENIQLHINNQTATVNNSILAQALLSNEEEECLYNCQMCDMNFNSIEEHLSKYHNGEEVILQTEEDEEEVEQMEEEQQITYILPDTFVESSNTSRNKNTIEEQECLDKDGRLYTRKVVKIDKFWTQENTLEPPLCEKYIMEDGVVKKITDEEAQEIDDPSKLMDVFQCKGCCSQFPTSDNYYKHKCTEEKTQTKFRCTHCSAIFLNYKSLHVHMKCHVNKDPTGEVRKTVTVGPFVCDVCNTLFPSFKSLRLHKRMHEPIKSKEPEAPVNYSISGELVNDTKENIRAMFLCNICDKTYDKEYEEIHMKSHTNDNNFDCEVCNRKFYTQENLEMHMKAHNNVRKISCSYCKKTFISNESLNEHVKSQCQKRSYECQYCGRRFARPHEKVKHERIHTGEKPHVCQVCGKSFRVSYCLTLHLRTHSGTRPYQCQFCEKRFKSHSVYNHHLLTHSDVRAYKCPYCPKAFKTTVQLAGHKNSHIKPFACTECNRPFASLYAVRAHMETHKRENNLKYDCYLCGASYARSFALRDHMRAQHNNTEEKPPEALGISENDDEMLIALETVVSTEQIKMAMNEDVKQEAL